jgi:signal transduction histidine kinase
VTDDLERLSTDARRIESLMRRSPDDRTDVALAPLVEAVVADVRTAHPDVDASVAVSVPDVTVRTDPHLCRYALGNVVENALEHTDSRTPRVEVTGRETGDGVRVVVADDGPGIPEAEVAVIEASGEDPHAHASRLGLWGTNWAVRSLGGRLSFGESDLGGAAVAIHLPAGRE